MKLRHTYPFIIIGLVLLASIYIVLLSDNSSVQNTPTQQQPEISREEENNPTEYSASFLIFTNGTKRIFTDDRYHNKSPDVYIENPNPATIQVKNSGITWQDFFNTLPMGLSKSCLTTGTGQSFCDGQGGKLRFFLNGTENPDVLEKEIQPFDKLLITFGNATDTQIQQQYDQISGPSASSSAN